MKTYEITLLTPQGFKLETYTENKPLQQFENEMQVKHGTFITIESKEMKHVGSN